MCALILQCGSRRSVAKIPKPGSSANGLIRNWVVSGALQLFKLVAVNAVVVALRHYLLGNRTIAT
jgi:hypothetical protein